MSDQEKRARLEKLNEVALTAFVANHCGGLANLKSEESIGMALFKISKGLHQAEIFETKTIPVPQMKANMFSGAED